VFSNCNREQFIIFESRQRMSLVWIDVAGDLNLSRKESAHVSQEKTDFYVNGHQREN
jgi:ribosomal protein L18E